MYSRKEKKLYGLEAHDYTFHAIMKRGSLVASPSKAYVEAIDFSSKEFVVELSPMQASVLVESWPDFETGLLGIWRLVYDEKVKKPSLSFIRPSTARSPAEIKAFLCDSESHVLFREAYKATF